MLDFIFEAVGEVFSELVGMLFRREELQSPRARAAWSCLTVLILLLLGCVVLAVIDAVE